MEGLSAEWCAVVVEWNRGGKGLCGGQAGERR